MDPIDPRSPLDLPRDRESLPARLGEPSTTDDTATDDTATDDTATNDPAPNDTAPNDTEPSTTLDPEVATEVTALLALAGRLPDADDLGAADRMPPDVSDRITLALADAARLRVDPGPLTATERGATVTPFVASSIRTTRRTPWMAVAAVAAAVAVIAVGGSALHLNKRSHGAAALSDTTTAAPKSTTQPAPRLGAVHIQASDTLYAAGNLADRARTLLTNPGPQLDPGAAAAAGPVGTPAGLTSCLTGLRVVDAAAVSVDLATFDGSPAAVLVVTNNGDSSAWVVARSCTAADPVVLKAATDVP
ncbi:MAG: hypothetical protein L0H96_12845 [Humibacillus sp.]|nr:hypothetical protein [Humibacillus sp.]MDN5777793.1 hypothetical protein [Humibacillus sp.]